MRYLETVVCDLEKLHITGTGAGKHFSQIEHGELRALLNAAKIVLTLSELPECGRCQGEGAIDTRGELPCPDCGGTGAMHQ